MSEILVAAQVMERLGIKSSTLGRWCAEARAGTGTFPLPFSELGKQRRWLASSIENWVERQHAVSSVSLPKQCRIEKQQAETQKILAKHYPHRSKAVE